MRRITVDFSSPVGPVKPMHSVNNGPAYSREYGNFKTYRDAGFPLARTHDAAFCSYYGGQHTVDIINIFPDFSKDENDPASYDFDLTDEYMENILATGTRVFYRLGNKIEHESKRYGSLPPADYEKWARVCEHIVRHMNEGWANGHAYGIEYWEIWNEPDLHPQCWDGSDEAFYPLFDIAARHLKKCFPHLKIGGPAVTSVYSEKFLDGFFRYLTRDPEDPTPLDFFSFHRYARDPADYGRDARAARKLCDRFGYTGTELILNEWNYVRNWTPYDDMLYSFQATGSPKGAAFVAAALIEAQKSPMDHFMYYDARIDTIWNGLFDQPSLEPKPPYWSMIGFRDLYRLGTEVVSSADDPELFVLAAKDGAGRDAAILAAWYRDGESLDGKGPEDKPDDVRVDWSGFASPGGVEVEYRVLDTEHALETVSAEVFSGERGAHVMRVRPYTVMLVTLRKPD
ncbi:MAG: hypothetical protein IKX85_03155 [Clostridia bacterium]|nr:hypothetical protein [Clostridia bacterium]